MDSSIRRSTTPKVGRGPPLRSSRRWAASRADAQRASRSPRWRTPAVRSRVTQARQGSPGSARLAALAAAPGSLVVLRGPTSPGIASPAASTLPPAEAVAAAAAASKGPWRAADAIGGASQATSPKTPHAAPGRRRAPR